MEGFRYPTSDAQHLVERIDAFPPGVRARRWVVRDDNQQHYHAVVRLVESPTYIQLLWKPTTAGVEQLVGRFKLHLAELLAADHVRFEREAEAGQDIRLRFYRGAGGVIFIQARADRPELPIGQVTL